MASKNTLTTDSTIASQLQDHQIYPNRQPDSLKLCLQQEQTCKRPTCPSQTPGGTLSVGQQQMVPSKATQVGHEPHDYLITNNNGTMFRSNQMMDYTATQEQSAKALKCLTQPAPPSSSPNASRPPTKCDALMCHFC